MRLRSTHGGSNPLHSAILIMKKIKVLITAGGTVEPIDGVRSITNTSTGALGKMIADEFAKTNSEVIHLCSKTSVKPKNPKVKCFPDVTDALSLKELLTEKIKTFKPDVIIHSMAVSDYRVKGICKIEKRAMVPIKKTSKISSEINDLALILKKNPKIISILRKLSPNSIIVGFKLTSNAEKEDTISKAKELLMKNKLNFVLSNDTKNLSTKNHIGYLTKSSGDTITVKGKEKIAKMIVKACIGGGK